MSCVTSLFGDMTSHTLVSGAQTTLTSRQQPARAWTVETGQARPGDLKKSDSKVRYITSLKRGDMGIRGKIHPEDTL